MFFVSVLHSIWNWYLDISTGTAASVAIVIGIFAFAIVSRII